MSQTKKICCPVCFEAYKEANHAPRVLACGHTICTPCLITIISAPKEQSKCPECRIKINSTKAVNFPINYTVLQLVNNYSAVSSSQREVNQMVAHLNNMKDRITEKITEIQYNKQSNQNSILILKSQIDALADDQIQLDMKVQELGKWLEDINVKEGRVLKKEGLQDARDSLALAEESLFGQTTISNDFTKTSHYEVNNFNYFSLIK